VRQRAVGHDMHRHRHRALLSRLARKLRTGISPRSGSREPYSRCVVDDSALWRDELLKTAARLEARTKQTRWTDRTGYLIERDFAASAYAMRKLVAAGETPVGVNRRQVPVRRFELTGRRPRSADDIADCYDFDNGRRKMISLIELSDEILHSVVFAFCCGETEDLFDGVYVSSDGDQNAYVYLMLASDFIALCGDVGVGDTQPR
jgi:hypothetical protein